MSAQQPEALRLAQALLEPVVLDKHAMQAAAELRRLHAVEQQRDELLEALREMVDGDAEAIAEADALGVPFPDEMLTAYRRAKAVIAKVEGGEK